MFGYIEDVYQLCSRLDLQTLDGHQFDLWLKSLACWQISNGTFHKGVRGFFLDIPGNVLITGPAVICDWLDCLKTCQDFCHAHFTGFTQLWILQHFMTFLFCTKVLKCRPLTSRFFIYCKIIGFKIKLYPILIDFFVFVWLDFFQG